MPVLRPRASSPYHAGGSGRRAAGWNASSLGVNTLLWGNLDQIRRRSRDEIRNNPWATSAVDNFEANVIGTGISPQWQIKNEPLRLQIQEAWDEWTDEVSADGLLNFYGLEALSAREVFEAGEVLIRFHVRPSSWGMSVPLGLQLIEGEQLPTYLNIPATDPKGNSVFSGIETDYRQRRVSYRLYRNNPGDSSQYPGAFEIVPVPASEVVHVFKPLRAGQLRGQPALTAVLALLYELEQYSDAELVRKKLAAMFAGFIKQSDSQSAVLPPAPTGTTSQTQDTGTAIGKLEAGTLQQLLPGEDITFPQVPESGDFESALRVYLHKFAAGIGATYEQITGDLKGVNYSSIRAGLLEFRRRCEQFQYNVIVHQMCQPIAKRWLKEAVLCGRLNLPGYLENPRQYHKIRWDTPGWKWVDPAKEVQAYEQAVRDGFTSREQVVAETGRDSAAVDQEQARDNARADALKLSYDSDGRKVLTGRSAGMTEAEIEDETQNGGPNEGKTL